MVPVVPYVGPRISTVLAVAETLGIKMSDLTVRLESNPISSLVPVRRFGLDDRRELDEILSAFGRCNRCRLRRVTAGLITAGTLPLAVPMQIGRFDAPASTYHEYPNAYL